MSGKLVTKVSLVLLVIGAGVLFSGCAIGFRAPATDITTTTATLNGGVGSNRTEPGEWFFKYGKTTAYENETPHRSIQFTAFEGPLVSEPVSGLEPGTTYHYVACADDQEPGVDAFCSHDQTFTTDYDPTGTLTRDCSQYPPSHGVHGSGSGYPPNASIYGKLDFPDGTSLEGGFFTDPGGNVNYGTFFSSVAGTWTGTVTWSGGTLVTSLFVDCAEPSQPDT